MKLSLLSNDLKECSGPQWFEYVETVSVTTTIGTYNNLFMKNWRK